jgi:WD40-like Beta Propeller Repeat
MRFAFISLFFIPVIIHGQTNNAYFNQVFPGKNLAMFAPNIISDEFGNRDMAISPEGDEIFYTMQFNYGMLSTILYSKKINGKWTAPEVADFCGQYKDLEPAFSFDGSKLYFSSTRPLNDTGSEKDYDIWYATKTNGKWGNAVNMKTPVNSDKDEYYASVAKNNNIYFTRAVEGREEDIMVCKFTNGKYTEAESLPDSINSTGDEFNAFVDPGENYIIFSGYKRKDGYGNGDLYISKKNEKGEWQQAKNLGAIINSSKLDYCPYVTPDKKYFFFTSNRHNIKTPFKKAKTFKELKTIMHNPLNGFDNIYWIEASEVLQ